MVEATPRATGDAPTAAVLLIGNELLSGRTRDLNLPFVAERLAARGIRLVEARVIGDDASAIVQAVNELRARHDLVLTTGGIGPTHDDITADCIAQAFGVELIEHPEARRRIETYAASRGYPVNADTLRMARIPAGAALIDNPVSAAPGFRLNNTLVMAGVPTIMQAMLDGQMESLPSGPVVHSVSVSAHEIGESRIAASLRSLQAAHPDVDIGSYPGREEGRPRLELVARSSDAAQLSEVEAQLRKLLDAAGR